MCLTKRLLSEPLFSVGTGVQEFNRYPSTVNRQPCSCLMQWSDRGLTAFGMSHRTAPPEPLFYVTGLPGVVKQAIYGQSPRLQELCDHSSVLVCSDLHLCLTSCIIEVMHRPFRKCIGIHSLDKKKCAFDHCRPNAIKMIFGMSPA